MLRVRYAQNSGKKRFFRKIFAILPPTRQFGDKKRKLSGGKLGK